MEQQPNNPAPEFPDWYHTSNIWIAAFLVATGAALPRVDRGKRGRGQFWFSDPDGELAWQALKFDSDEPVGIKKFSAAMRTLKDAINQQFGR